MVRTFALAAAVAALALPLAARAERPRAEGRIDSDDGRLEILGRPVRVGEKIELPEGFIRVEEAGTEDRRVGSFAVVPARSMRAAVVASASAEEANGPAARRAEGAAACRAERTAYLRELWRMSGIDVKDPEAVLAGLESGDGAQTGFYWFALATDPFRPLAWSSDLRARADALARCVRAN